MRKKKVYAAMSGGVDSSVAAALLKNLPAGRQGGGFDVVGVFMKPWSSELTTSNVVSDIRCPWKEDREDAMRAASVIGIPLLTWDFSKQYKKSVTDYMLREYGAGRTPNPDVMCNKHIKFGLFLKKALREGADFIATGHYIRIQNSKIKNQNDKSKFKIIYKLLTANDKNKDQSYFLWTLNQKILSKCIFPIGDYVKPEVREMAKKFGLSNYAKKDSQGVCFIGPLDMKDFLKTKIKPRKGKILDLKGKVVGVHDGIFYYTIGQRHGLNIGLGGGPYYVVAKDLKKNIVYVGKEKDLLSKNTRVSDINWINGKVKLPGRLDVRLRYRAGLKKAILRKNGDLELESSERAITEGQSAVFYRGKEILGGGVVK